MSPFLHVPLAALLALTALVGTASGQTPAPAKPAPSPAQAAPAPDLPSPPPNFVYSPEGRRDPFSDLLTRGADARSAPARKAEGAAGIAVADLTVKGIVQSRGAWMAMVSGTDNKVTTVRAGDRLLDGTVKTVTSQAVVMLQEVNDPLSLEKQREVRKFLRGGDEVK